MLPILLLILTLTSSIFAKIPSGLYIDNGLDQTSIERSLSKDEKQELELEILNLLGLPTKPNIKEPIKTSKSKSKYLMDVYKTLLEEENSRHERSVDTYFTAEEQSAIEESDIIMTFDSVSHHVSSVRHERGKRLWFNVSEVPVGEQIIGAELRIFQNATMSKMKPDNKYTVAAYQVTRNDQGERELELLSSVNTTAGYYGWLELNITGTFASWVALPESNKGLYLSVHPVDKPAHETKPEDVGLTMVKGGTENQPFMVGFLKTNNQIKVRRRRQVWQPKTRRIKQSDYPSVMLKSRREAENAHNSKTCRLHTFYINFQDLKFHQYIIAPDGYTAYYCAGECNFPLNSHMNATNHAIVQTLVHLNAPTKYPKPCCAPTKLIPMSVLFHMSENSVTLKKYKKMVVKSCGCH